MSFHVQVQAPFPNGIFPDWGMPISPFGEAYDQPHPITGLPCEPWIWPKLTVAVIFVAIPWQDLLQLNSLTGHQMAGRSAVSTWTRWCLGQVSILSHLQLWEVSGAVLFAYFKDSTILFPNLVRCLSQSQSETFDVQVFRSSFIYIFIYILYVCYVWYIIYIYIYINYNIYIYILESEWQMPQEIIRNPCI